MPTLHRRNGSVKYVPPKRLLEGLRPAVAIPATLFAGLVVIGIAFALYKTPKEQKWVNLRPELAWRPAVSDNGEALEADERFLFTSPLDRARIPSASRQGASPEQTGEAFAPAVGLVTLASLEQMLVEHAIGRGVDRRFARSRLTGVTHANAGVGTVVQRGDRIAEGRGISVRSDDGVQSLPDASSTKTPEIREPLPEQELRFGS